MEIMKTLGEITQGHGAGLELKAKATAGISVGALFANAMSKSSIKQDASTFDANNISSLHIGKTQGLLGKWVESESIPVADVKKIKK